MLLSRPASSAECLPLYLALFDSAPCSWRSSWHLGSVCCPLPAPWPAGVYCVALLSFTFITRSPDAIISEAQTSGFGENQISRTPRHGMRCLAVLLPARGRHPALVQTDRAQAGRGSGGIRGRYDRPSPASLPEPSTYVPHSPAGRTKPRVASLLLARGSQPLGAQQAPHSQPATGWLP